MITIDSRKTQVAPKPDQLKLTTREMQLLQLIAAGHMDKAAAHEMGVSVGTLKVHKRTLYMRLGAKTPGHAVALGYKKGILHV